jgi:hypothetical protein
MEWYLVKYRDNFTLQKGFPCRYVQTVPPVFAPLHSVMATLYVATELNWQDIAIRSCPVCTGQPAPKNFLRSCESLLCCVAQASRRKSYLICRQQCHSIHELFCFNKPLPEGVLYPLPSPLFNGYKWFSPRG